MKRILVPTDFSVKSKSGVRFAIHWAAQQKVELIFVHVVHLWKRSQWTDSYFEKYVEEEEKNYRLKLEKFITGIYKGMHAKKSKHSFVIIQGIGGSISILDYCQKDKNIDFICISTRGAGKANRVLGTNTGNLITHSEVPVLAVPENYKVSNIRKVLYATDLRNYSEEIKKVIAFASPFKAPIDVLHFAWPDEIIFDKKIVDAVFKKQYKYTLNVTFEENGVLYSLVENLQNQIRLKKPSLVVMFTNQNRTFFQKIFLPSQAEKLSFHLKTPLLVFNKP